MKTFEKFDWGTFYLKDIFTFIKGDQNNMSSLEGGVFPLISAKNNNNACKGFVTIAGKKIYNAHCITLNNDGDGGAGLAFYQPHNFALDSHVTALIPNSPMSRFQQLFVSCCISKQKERFGNGYPINGNRLKSFQILLPISDDGSPDWQFMEDYMKQQEYKMLQKVHKRLAGKVVSSLITRGSLSECKWKEFYFTDVFDEIQRGKRITKAQQIEGDVPYISSTAMNNGVDGFVGNTERVRIFENCITLANSGSVGNAFFQSYRFVASDHVTKLKATKLDKYGYLFMLPIINRLSEKYSFNREINDERIKREKLLLPVKENNDIDFEFMSLFAQKLETESIKNLIDLYSQRIDNHAVKWGGVKWNSYFIEDVADILSGRDIYERERVSGYTPYVTATANQNGIGYFVSNENSTLEARCLSVNRNGSVGYAFYHNYSALFSNDCRKLRLKNNTKNVGIFIAQQVTAQRSKYGYGYKMGTGRLKRQMIMLPSCNNGQPDYTFMDKYIEQLEIKQIVEYLEYSIDQ